jgi:prolyl-tRNA synthetase
MKSFNDLEQLFNKLSLTLTHETHEIINQNQNWLDVMKSKIQSSDSIILTKTLLIKPKKSSSLPVFVILQEDTKVNIGQLIKLCNVKDGRLASDEFISEIFNTHKSNRKTFNVSLS